MFSRTHCIRASLLGAAVLLATSFTPAQAVPSLECGGPSFESPPDPSRHQVLDIPTKGWLLVDVGASDEAPVWFDIAHRDCRRSGPLVVLERGLDQGLFEVEPGPLELRYGTVEPGSRAPLRLSTHFVPDLGIQPRDGEEGDDTEAGDGEIVPKQGSVPGDPDKDGEEEDDTEAGEGEIVPTHGLGDSTGPLDATDAIDTAWRGCLDSEEPFDDFALCAAWLEPGRRVEQRLGELGNADRDHFLFELEGAGRVRITLRGTVPMQGTVLLADGRPLASRRDPGGEGLTIELDLVAGTYLLRLEGLDQAPGAYEVRLDTSVSLGTL